jgi:hypothetical protein
VGSIPASRTNQFDFACLLPAGANACRLREDHQIVFNTALPEFVQAAFGPAASVNPYPARQNLISVAAQGIAANADCRGAACTRATR